LCPIISKVIGIGEDGLGYRYFTGPKKENSTKGKFYSGVPITRREELANGLSLKIKPINNLYNLADSFGNCRHEGEIEFRNGKKPLALLKILFDMALSSDDLVLPGFHVSINYTLISSNQMILIDEIYSSIDRFHHF
jgi:adenine-specific DNA-methyltransferase